MIDSLDKANAVQARRIVRGKRGLPRAVRRYLIKLATTNGKFEWYRYNDLKQTLPQLPITQVNNDVEQISNTQTT